MTRSLERSSAVVAFAIASLSVGVCTTVLVFVGGAAEAAATGGDGPGGTVTVGAGSGSSTGGSPGSPGAPGSGSSSGGSTNPSICTYTLLTLNTQTLPPGGHPAGVEAVMAELVHLVAEGVEPLESVHPSTMELYRSLTRRKSPPRTR